MSKLHKHIKKLNHTKFNSNPIKLYKVLLKSNVLNSNLMIKLLIISNKMQFKLKIQM